VNYSETEQKVITLVSTALNVNSINLQSSQENTSEWDSLAYLSVISAMEEEFEIEISEKNINNFGSVKNILNEVNHL
jgi:acyl carrier protein|tara:strand:- start:942 stop:1172 length:231 start_codon:yes stop_codon:yes gene_type:complete